MRLQLQASMIWMCLVLSGEESIFNRMQDVYLSNTGPSLAQFDIWSDVFGQKTQAQCGRVIQMHRLRKFPNVQYLWKDVKGDVHAHLHRLRPKWKTLTTSLKAWRWTQEWWSWSTMFSFTHLRSVVNWELNCGAHWKKDRRGKKLPRVCRIC